MSGADSRDILLVEDNPDHAELTRRALAKGGDHNVTWVKDGQEALDFLRREGGWADYKGDAPSVILLDIGLPKIGGRDVLRAIKQDERLRYIPVIMLTTSGDPDDVAHCYDLGANSYVMKALDFSDFMARVKAIKEYWVNTNVFPEAFALASA
jgi:two-component system response regulator